MATTTDNIERGAIFSQDSQYRYALHRIWDDSKKKVMFIGFNPSTADGQIDDATVKKLIKYCKLWDYGGLYICNLFAFVAKNPLDIDECEHPIGSSNDYYLQKYSVKSDKIIVMWGRQGAFYNNRIQNVLKIFTMRIYCFKLTKNKQPYQPLYLPLNTQLELFKQEESQPQNGNKMVLKYSNASERNRKRKRNCEVIDLCDNDDEIVSQVQKKRKITTNKNEINIKCEKNIKEENMKEEYNNNNIMGKHYTKWTAEDIICWLTELENGKFKKYSNLLGKFQEEEVCGKDLMKITQDHLKGWGVKKFSDKVDIYNHIQNLV
eukprot:460612_1